MRKQAGFTVIELAVAFIVLVVLATFFAIQRHDLDVASRDVQRKTAINAMYYNLTEVFYAEHQFYPENISRENLTAMDPALFTDPNGLTLQGNACLNQEGQAIGGAAEPIDDGCNYRYTPSDCNENGECQQFKLSAELEAEAAYSKTSPE